MRTLPRLLTLIVLLLITSPGFGQGTSGMLPDPIAGQDLNRYARRLELSDQQRLAIDRFHQAYLDAFKTLREEQIESFLGEASNLMRRFWTAPDTGAVREALKDFERLRTRIKSLDEQLFGQIEGLLSEDQAEAMLVVLHRRERERNRTGLVRMIGANNAGARVDLSRVFDELDLPMQEREDTQPLLEEYEAQLTMSTRRLARACERMIVEMTKTMAEQREAMEAGNARWQSMATIFADLSKEPSKIASEISQQNRRRERQLHALLPAESGARLRRAFQVLAYPEIGNGGAKMLDRLEAARRRSDLDEAVREGVVAMESEFRSAHDRLAEEMMDAIEDQRRTVTAFRFGRSQTSARLKLLVERRDELLSRTDERLERLLGADRLAAIDANLDESGRATSTDLPASAAAGAARSAAARAGTRRTTASTAATPVSAAKAFAGPDRFLPPPITTSELRWYADLLELDEDQVAILEALHMDYVDRWELARAEHVERVVESAQRLRAGTGRNDDTPLPTAEDVERLYTQRAEALSALRAIDSTFFDDVELTVIGDATPASGARLRASRDRVVYRRGAQGTTGTSNRWLGASGRVQRESAIDLVHVVVTSGLDGDGRAAAARALGDYERAVAENLKSQYEYLVATQQDSDLQRMMMYAMRRTGEMNWGEYRASARRSSGQLRGQLAPLQQQLMDLNGTTLESLAAALEPGAARSLRQRYRRATHPEVYDDAGAAEPVFIAALELGALSAEQRANIGEVFADYRMTYTAASEEMTKALEGEIDRNEPGRWQRYAERRNRLDKLRFERDEVNDKALRQLRSLLTDDQIQVLGLGPQS